MDVHIALACLHFIMWLDVEELHIDVMILLTILHVRVQLLGAGLEMRLDSSFEATVGLALDIRINADNNNIKFIFMMANPL